MHRLVSRLALVLTALVFGTGVAHARGALSGTTTKNSTALPSAYVDVVDSVGGFQEVQSGPTGAYSVPNVAAGSADVYCYSPDNKSIGHQVKNVPEGGTATADFDWSVGDVWGTVKKNGAVLAGARIRLNDVNNNWYEAYTNAEGNYYISDVTAGPVGVYCFDGSTQIGYKISSVGRGSLVEVSFNTWHFGSVAAHVTRGGANYANARVEVHDSMGNWRQGYTNTSGNCTLASVAVGSADVYIHSAEGWFLNQQTINVQQGQTSNVNFDWAAGTIEVTVTRNQQPLENAYVELDPTHFAYTDSTGHCSFTTEAGRKTVSVYHVLPGSVGDGYLIEARELDLLTGQTMQQTFDWRCGTVQGTVTRYMLPLAGAFVGVDNKGFVTTDASGQYSIDVTTGAQTISFYSPDPNSILMGTQSQPISEGQTYAINYDWRPGKTSVGGTIATDTTWTVQNSPYEVTSDVVVNSGVTLTIEPNAAVYFRPGTGMTVNGRLDASAVDGIGIYFGSSNEITSPYQGSPGDWKGIVFSGSASSSSVMSYCTIRYAGAGTNASAVCCSSSSPSITSCLISNVSGRGVFADTGSNPTIADCSINNNTGVPISVTMAATMGNTGTGNAAGNVIQINGSTLSANQTWTKQALEYRIAGTVTVRGATTGAANAATLTIEPGCMLRFADSAAIQVGHESADYWGRLAAQGTVENPITFTAANQTPGKWAGIYFTARTDATSVMDRCIVEYGGYTYSSNLYCYYSSPVITNCILRNSSAYGVSCYQSAAHITGCTVSQNSSSGIRVESGSSVVLSNNTCDSNAGYPISLHPNVVGFCSLNGDTATSNTPGNAVEIRSGTVSTDQTWPVCGDAMGYRVTGTVYVRAIIAGSANATALNIEPGCTLRFADNAGIQVGYESADYWGRLLAHGTAENPITFTAVNQTPGKWAGIYFTAKTDATSMMDRCIVEYGGYTYSSNVYCYYSSPTISNCILKNSSAYGIYCYQSSAEIAGCNVLQNASSGIRVESGSSVALSNNICDSNGGYPISLYADVVGFCSLSGDTATGNAPGNAVEIRGGTVSTNQTWPICGDAMGYRVTGTVAVYKGGQSGAANPVTLTIEPGCTLTFADNCGLQIGYASTSYDFWGKLVAQATVENPITFTAVNQIPGKWAGIYFTARTDRASVLDRCTVEYGGYDHSSNVYCNNSSPTITHCILRNSIAYGIYCYQSGAHITGCTVSQNSSSGIRIESGSSVVLSNNTCDSNGGYPISLHPDAVGFCSLSGDTATGNTPGNAVEIRSGTISTNQTWPICGDALGYRVTGNVTVSGSQAGTSNACVLTIAPGCLLRFADNTGLNVGTSNYGKLVAQGESDHPITFTAVNPTPGRWSGIQFGNNTVDDGTFLQHCTVEYGGYSSSAGVYCSQANPEIVNCVVAKSSGYGIRLDSASPKIKNSVISGNSIYGIYGASSGPVITYCDLWQNGSGNYSGVTPGTGCISYDPLFVEPASANYRLQPTSPCKDAGDPSMLDLIGSRIDIGAWSVLGNAVDPVSIGAGKAAPDGTAVRLQDKVVTRAYDGFFYLEADDRASGLKVTSDYGVTPGDRISTTGTILTLNGERLVSSAAVARLSAGNAVPDPLYVAGRSLGGGPCGSAPGTLGSSGLNNVGLLAKASGRVTAVVGDGFYLDDGSGRQSDGEHIGVKVASTGLPPGVTFVSPAEGRYVTVTGCIGAYESAGGIFPLIRPSDQSDLSYHRATLYSWNAEAGLGDWASMAGCQLLSISDAQAHTPTHSAFASSALQTSMHKTVTQQYPDRVFYSCWIYDTGVLTGFAKQYVMFRALDGATIRDYFGIGIYGPANSNYYCVGTKTQGWTGTAAGRSAGWHEFRIEVRPFTGTDDVWFFVDGVLAAKGKRSLNSFMTDLQIGASEAAGLVDAFYDDVRYGLTE